MSVDVVSCLRKMVCVVAWGKWTDVVFGLVSHMGASGSCTVLHRFHSGRAHTINLCRQSPAAFHTHD